MNSKSWDLPQDENLTFLSSTPKRKKKIKNENESLWWDSLDFHNYYKISENEEKEKDNEQFHISWTSNIILVNVNLWHPYETEILEIIKLFNTRCLIYRANIISFKKLCQIFNEYFKMVKEKIEESHSKLLYILNQIIKELYSYQFRVNFNISSIFFPILYVIKYLYLIRRSIDIAQLESLKTYIIESENYLTFQGKCLLDCLYQIKFRMINFNFYKSAIQQWNIPSQYNIFLDRKIIQYRQLSREVYDSFENFKPY